MKLHIFSCLFSRSQQNTNEMAKTKNAGYVERHTLHESQRRSSEERSGGNDGCVPLSSKRRGCPPPLTPARPLVYVLPHPSPHPSFSRRCSCYFLSFSHAPLCFLVSVWHPLTHTIPEAKRWNTNEMPHSLHSKKIVPPPAAAALDSCCTAINVSALACRPLAAALTR